MKYRWEWNVWNNILVKLIKLLIQIIKMQMYVFHVTYRYYVIIFLQNLNYQVQFNQQSNIEYKVMIQKHT